MINLLVTPSSTSSRKAKHWLLEHHVSFQERDMSRRALNASEIKLLLSLTENGCWDLVSTRCKVFKKLNVDIESLTLSQFIQLLTKHPEMIKRPIIFDRNTLQVGFNEDEIRSFLPRSVREKNFKHLLAKAN
ncbi:MULTISPECIES: transcriptional regulator Spx [Lentilactobacillus]|jgi:regulatory protein spx|uniref:Regulatory protein Spx n=2 Tax=Lentilactobacillus TaxID=2767893 RepID=A0A1X1FB28_9LACO|nr:MULTISPECIES: transcriptional regulator Spx [Lentilactobacillus]MCT3251941.1 Spx/MgsR family RNA polymerase-binding regulatory protein [Lentilactobacillus buchneri]MCT3546529.1 Spx/MgsR family RNA polymerase-binding regulatory protein [Lentilactobacillus buchneri]MCT3556260.1 Spx/MgsR family RNA polymerase-binding regulatory protein [Lentilactobacillus buchneri]MCT3559617.1 Spx/MgsR family RNA polymerase-binding regulatory protein [Lentilactobacillus buchneri]MCT4437119.1 Spx/MgsR family RN